MARDIKLNIVYVNKKGNLCEHEGMFTREETYKECKAFKLFKSKRVPIQTEMELT